MTRKFLTAMSLAVGIVAIGASQSAAEAGTRGHGGFHGGWHDDYGRFERSYHRPYKKRHYGLYGYDNFSPNCHRYLKKARWTGHRYWWRKYNRCMHAYH